MYKSMLCSQAMACEYTLSLVDDLDSMQESQETALMVAAREGSVGMVRKLVHQGATVNLTTKVCV